MDESSGKTWSDAGRSYAGPEILRIGFRPFFLAAGIWSALAVVLWLGGLTGDGQEDDPGPPGGGGVPDPGTGGSNDPDPPAPPGGGGATTDPGGPPAPPTF